MGRILLFAVLSCLVSLAAACSETCTKDTQCSAGSVCCGGACALAGERCEPCNNDLHCPAGERCLARRCVADTTKPDAGARDSGVDGGARDASIATRDGSTGARDASIADATPRDASIPHGTRALTKVLADETWRFGQSATGMTVDRQGRVYLVDYDHILRVGTATISVYMTIEDAESIVGQSLGIYAFDDIDIDIDGTLYILGDYGVITSDAPHAGDVYATIASSEQTFPSHIGVVSSEYVTVVSRDGLWRVRAGGNTAIYDEMTLGGGSSGCATEDLAMQRSGVFLYQRGCNGSPLTRGNVDGSGVGVLYDDQLGDVGEGVIDISNFLCSARDPAGGFYTMIDDDRPGTHLFHFDEDSTLTSGWREIPVSPTFAEAAEAEKDNETLLFRYCAMAVDSSGIVYIQSFSQLWRVD